MDTAAIIAAGESLTTEFKSDTNDKRFAKAVARLASGDGGVLLIGVAAYIQANTEPARGRRVLGTDR